MFLLAALSCGSDLTVEDRMQGILDRGIKKHNINGVSATVIFPNGRIWNGVSGISHGNVPMRPDMLFAIGSVTKNVVAALTLKLVEEDLLLLEDPVSRWLPSFPYVDGQITIRQLLNHTSGIHMFWDSQQIWDDLKKDRAKIWSPDEVLTYIEEPYFAAGEGWRYSNTNYLLLAMILKKATGSRLSAGFSKHFWHPLGIADAYVSQEEGIPDNLAHVYGDNFQPGEPNTDVTFIPRAAHESIGYGSSGIFTTSETLARWSHSLFGGRVLQQTSLDEMLEFVKINPAANMAAYGLGVQVYTRRFSSGQHAIGHGGGNIGTTSYMVYLPEYHVSIAVMVNAFPNKGASAITKGLIRIVLRDLGAIGIVPYFEFLPTGLLIVCIGLSASTITVSLLIRRRRLRQE